MRHDMWRNVWCHVMRCDAIPCDVMRCDAMWCGLMWSWGWLLLPPHPDVDYSPIIHSTFYTLYTILYWHIKKQEVTFSHSFVVTCNVVGHLLNIKEYKQSLCFLLKLMRENNMQLVTKNLQNSDFVLWLSHDKNKLSSSSTSDCYKVLCSIRKSSINTSIKMNNYEEFCRHINIINTTQIWQFKFESYLVRIKSCLLN